MACDLSWTIEVGYLISDCSTRALKLTTPKKGSSVTVPLESRTYPNSSENLEKVTTSIITAGPHLERWPERGVSVILNLDEKRSLPSQRRLFRRK